MSLRAFRLVTALSATLVTVSAGFAFFSAPEIGSAYLGLTRGDAASLPRLTHEVAVPLLRIGPHDAHERPVTRPWVGLVWACVLLAPSLIATWSIRATTPEDAVARWLAGFGVYLPMACLVALVILLGLAAPFACL